MPKIITAAAIVGGVGVGYKDLYKSPDANQFGRDILKHGIFIVVLGVLSMIKTIEPLTIGLGAVYIVIIVLNTGYDAGKEFGLIKDNER